MIYPTIPSFDVVSSNQARNRQGILTKPAGALGLLEELSIKLAGMTGKERPRFHRKGVIIMAADHGIAMEGVSAYPPEVTPQMVLNFLNNGAAVNVLARQAGAFVSVVDIGVSYDFQNIAGLLHRKIAFGTMNMLKGPAMTRSQAEDAIRVGMDVVQSEINHGLDLVATGEMGIGNTSPSSAMTAVLTGLPVEKVTGRGTGLDERGFNKKITLIQDAIRVNEPDPGDVMDVLTKLGGLEIAGLAGVALGAAARRVPVVVDGFISGVAALVAAELVPEVKPYLIASHQSVEIGHQAVLAKLGLRPILNLDLRLGEGTGAVLAFHLIEAAVRILDEMATFSEAGVSGKE
jgi:nicotinate-nucleotide--dimethylbenzimidazole phosphoribosyltransferase